MTITIEADLIAKQLAAEAAENRAKAERRAAVDQLRWIERNRLKIDSEALALLRAEGDDSMASHVDRAWSRAMQAVRDRQAEQTAKARKSVLGDAEDEQGSAPSSGLHDHGERP